MKGLFATICLTIAVLLVSAGFTATTRAGDVIHSKEHRFKAVTIATGLAHPWEWPFCLAAISWSRSE